GVHTITDNEAQAGGAHYLTDEITTRLAREPVGFTLWWTFPDEGDPLDDPTQVWPQARRQVEAGHLQITALASDQAASDRMIWDPNRVVDGDACSGDPILAARGGAYGVSYTRRTSRVQRDRLGHRRHRPVRTRQQAPCFVRTEVWRFFAPDRCVFRVSRERAGRRPVNAVDRDVRLDEVRVVTVAVALGEPVDE